MPLYEYIGDEPKKDGHNQKEVFHDNWFCCWVPVDIDKELDGENPEWKRVDVPSPGRKECSACKALAAKMAAVPPKD